MGRTRSWMVSILMFLNEFSSCVFQWSSHSVSWVQYQMSLEVLKSLGHRLTDPGFARSLQYPPVTACHGDGKSRKERPCFYGTIIKWESPWPLPCKWLAEASLFHTFKGFIFHPYTIQTCAGGNQFLPWRTYLVCEDSCLISNYFVRTYPLYQANEHDDNLCLWHVVLSDHLQWDVPFLTFDQRHDIPSGYVKIAIENDHL